MVTELSNYVKKYDGVLVVGPCYFLFQEVANKVGIEIIVATLAWSQNRLRFLCLFLSASWMFD